MQPNDQSQEPLPNHALPPDFLSGPNPDADVIVQKIDFSKTALPEYKDLYAVIIDNVLNEEECKALVRAAEAHADGKWEQAMVNVGGGLQRLISDVRDCGRIIWDDHTVVEKIWSRVKESVPEIEFLENAARVTGYGPVKRGEKYQMSRLNERMRFLKYGPGQYFKREQAPPPLSSIHFISFPFPFFFPCPKPHHGGVGFRERESTFSKIH